MINTYAISLSVDHQIFTDNRFFTYSFRIEMYYFIFRHVFIVDYNEIYPTFIF